MVISEIARTRRDDLLADAAQHRLGRSLDRRPEQRRRRWGRPLRALRLSVEAVRGERRVG
jgi:hypothetical protein